MTDNKKKPDSKQITLLTKEEVLSAKPFLKWAGGKGQLLDEITERLPKNIQDTKQIDNYVEPFVGGGAVFFHLRNNFEVRKATLIDINRELIIGYRVIQKNPHKLIEKLSAIEKKYLEKSQKERKKFYYQTRESYNEQMLDFDYKHYNDEWIVRAKYLIFMNRTCFNGLFRLNKKGEFNVPFGRYKNPTICHTENILEVHRALQGTNIIRGDFTEAEKFIQKKTFVYFDPPYRPLSSTANFTDYSKSGFNEKDQIRLGEFFQKMDEKGAYLMLSNSDPKNEDPDDDFFDDLYKNFIIKRVKAKRAISCKGSGRGEITELLITNY